MFISRVIRKMCVKIIYIDRNLEIDEEENLNCTTSDMLQR